jgi:hypothetical protein
MKNQHRRKIMDPIKFSEEYSRSGMIYYEPVNAEAHELMDFMGVDHAYYLNETKAERVFGWLEKLGHEVMIVQGKNDKQMKRI